MDRARIWAARILAPIAFIVAAAVLVVVVQRGLDDSQQTAQTGEQPAGSVPVVTPPAESEAAPAERRFYRVRTGDTLQAIAARFDTTVSELLQLNPDVDPLALSPGQRIRVAEREAG